MTCREALPLIFDGAAPEQHLAACAPCKALAESLARLDDALRAQPQVEPPADLAARVAASIVGERRVIAWDVWKVAAAVVVSIGAASAYWFAAKPELPRTNAAAVERGVKRNVEYWISGGFYGR